MYHSKSFPQRKTVLLLVLLMTLSATCSRLAAQSLQNRGPQELPESFPGKGLRITAINNGSPAARAGLKPMDLLFRYGDFEIVDDASFFAAREVYEQSRGAQIPVAVWRDGKALRLMVAPGRLGMDSNESNPVAYQFESLMERLNTRRQIPEYQREHEFKDSLTLNEELLEEAKQLIDKAEREATLTPTQVLVARISMIQDDASPEDLKRQSAMMAQFIGTQPVAYVIMLGQSRMFEKKRFRPAVECFKRYLESNPADVSIRLNMSVAYSRLHMFAEAEAAVDYVLDHGLGLSQHGYLVAYQMKAMGVLNRGDYGKTISFAERAFEIEPRPFTISMVLLAAAQTGDLQKLAAASRQFQQLLPKEFEPNKLQVAAAEALALTRSNQRKRARALVQNWKDTDRIEGRLKAFWKMYPGGSDIWNNWSELTRN